MLCGYYVFMFEGDEGDDIGQQAVCWARAAPTNHTLHRTITRERMRHSLWGYMIHLTVSPTHHLCVRFLGRRCRVVLVFHPCFRLAGQRNESVRWRRSGSDTLESLPHHTARFQNGQRFFIGGAVAMLADNKNNRCTLYKTRHKLARDSQSWTS